MTNRVVIQNKQLTEQLLHMVSLSKDQENVYLNVNLMDRFKIEKTFKNNFGGLHMLEVEREKLDSEEKVFRYLRIGATNERSKS